MELVQSGRELVLLAALLHFHGHRDHRLREWNLRQDQAFVPGGQRVVGVRVTQLGDAADVARVQLRHFDPLLADRHTQVVQLLADVARGVVDVLPVFHRARVDAEQRHVADMRLGYRLEDLSRERPGLVRFQRQSLGAAPFLRFDRRPLVRRGA